MKYILTAPMRDSGAIGLFYVRSITFESDSDNPETIKYDGIVSANTQGQEIGHGPCYVINSSGGYVYPAGFKGE